MYRRIQLILHFEKEDGTVFHLINGLMGASSDQVSRAWCNLNIPRRAINKNVRFYFTEAGWEKFGRNTVAACIRTGQEYQVIAVEEHKVDVMYRDEHQVCIRPKRRLRRGKALGSED